MSDLHPLAVHPDSGHVDFVRCGARFSGVGDSTVQHDIARFQGLRKGEDSAELGAFQLAWEVVRQGQSASIQSRVSNRGHDELFLKSVVFGFAWRTEIPASLRFLKNGWQSWSYTGPMELDLFGEPEFPSGPWLRGMHHVSGDVPEDRAGWHESASVSVAGSGEGGRACLVGVLETGKAFGLVYLRRAEGGIEIELEQLLDCTLAAGETLDLEVVRAGVGLDASRLLESFADLWGQTSEARTRAPFQAGWCSWYHFFHDVTERDLLRNLDALAQCREDLPIDIVQLDDGYQRAIGDWRETNEKFPSSLPQLAKLIRERGFVPGLWTAPFCVVRESDSFRDHADWLLRSDPGDEDPFFRGTLHPVWAEDSRVYTLDTTQPEVLAYLRTLFGEFVEMGFSYLKLDFLHTVSGRGHAMDSRVSRSMRLRMGLESIREGAGKDAFLLGCGCPLGPAVGLVDGMRIGPDVAPAWFPPSPAIPGIEAALPSTHSAVRSVLSRAWMHRRLWLNDPDCLMARTTDTQLTEPERTTLANAIAATGGMVVFSDDVPGLKNPDIRRIAETLEVARAVDSLASRGQARCEDLLGTGVPTTVIAQRGTGGWLGLFNAGESEWASPARPDLRLLPLGGSAKEGSSLEPHASELTPFRDLKEWAIFCDFDGTFSVQDVGSTIAKEHQGHRRPAVNARFRKGEITAWESNMELLDGLELSEPELLRFLHTIDLDPGAAELIEWCTSREILFEILSDGFDYNLDRLKEIHQVQFSYAANQLRIEDGRWRIAPGHPNPDCSCGTGTCKWGKIQAFRSENPDVVCVHIGNGQVSDLCGALAADVAFAKDTLAPALAARGESYEEFETLRDVIATLEGWGL